MRPFRSLVAATQALPSCAVKSAVPNGTSAPCSQAWVAVSGRAVRDMILAEGVAWLWNFSRGRREPSSHSIALHLMGRTICQPPL
jgi:hypothetical protein